MDKPGSSLKRSLSNIGRQISFRQPIRPFISSTFIDFYEERDHLVKRIFPQLHSLCHNRGTHFSPVDLRWGINEEQSQSGHVISLCLDYINSCSPFFICFLGERYGSRRPRNAKPLSADTAPDTDSENFSWMDKNYLVAAANGHNWVMQEAYQYCSVTELEIIQAAYLNDSQHCRFYFRDARHIEDKFVDLPSEKREDKLKVYRCENAETELMVHDLKRRIVNKGLPVRFYRTVEELGEKILQDWTVIVNQLYPPLLNFTTDVDGEQFREWAAHEAYAETRRRVFVQTTHIEDLFQKLDDHGLLALDRNPEEEKFEKRRGQLGASTKRPMKIDPNQQKTPSILTLVGERGCGKTALVANWAKQFKRSYPGLKVISHFVGSSALSTDITSFLRRVTYELRGEFVGGQNETSSDTEDMSNFHHICEAFVAAVAMGPCVLALDGIDELSGTLGQSMHQVKEMSWLPAKLPPQCQIILSTVRSDLTYKTLSQREDTQVLLVPLSTDKAQKSTMVTDNLAAHCKCLDPAQLEKVITSKLSDRPLFLSIVANELRVCGTYGNLDQVMEQYTEAATFRDLWKCVIQRWVRDYGWTTDGRTTSLSSKSNLEDMSGWVADTLRLISCSRHGLSESDILEVLRMMGYTGQAEVLAFDFALFRSATFDALVERPGGLLNFFHQHLREAVEHSLLGMVGGSAGMPDSPKASAANLLSVGMSRQKRLCHETLSNYFWKQPHSLRRTGELPWQLEKCGDVRGLYNILTVPEVFLMMCQDSIQSFALKLDLLRYWQRLTNNGYDISKSYHKVVMQAVSDHENEVGHQGIKVENGQVKAMVVEEVCIATDSQVLGSSVPTIETPALQNSGAILQKDAKKDGKDTNHNISYTKDSATLSPEQDKTLKIPMLTIADNELVSHVCHASSSSSDEEVWEDARDGTEPSSNEEDIFYEFKPEDRCQLAVLAMHAGKFLAEKAKFMHSEKLLQLAHEEIKTKFPLSTPEQLLLTKVEENLGDLHRFQLQNVAAKEFYHKALNTLSNIAAHESDDIYKQLLENQGRILNHLGFMAVKRRTKVLDWEAEPILRKASQCMREANSIAGLATAQFILGLVQIKKFDFVSAQECLREAVRTRERWYGKSHPHVAEVLNELGGLLCNKHNIHRYDSIIAESYFRRALHIRTQSFGRDHLLVGTTLFHLGKLLMSSGNQQCKTESVGLLGRAHDIRTTHLGANHVLTKAVRQTLKEVQKQLNSGDYDYAPVKQPDRRTQQHLYSALSWHHGDLLSFERRTRSKSATPYPENREARQENVHVSPTVRNAKSTLTVPQNSYGLNAIGLKVKANSMTDLSTEETAEGDAFSGNAGFKVKRESIQERCQISSRGRGSYGNKRNTRPPRSTQNNFIRTEGMRQFGRPPRTNYTADRTNRARGFKGPTQSKQTLSHDDLGMLCSIPRSDTKDEKKTSHQKDESLNATPAPSSHYRNQLSLERRTRSESATTHLERRSGEACQDNVPGSPTVRNAKSPLIVPQVSYGSDGLGLKIKASSMSDLSKDETVQGDAYSGSVAFKGGSQSIQQERSQTFSRGRGAYRGNKCNTKSPRSTQNNFDHTEGMRQFRRPPRTYSADKTHRGRGSEYFTQSRQTPTQDDLRLLCLIPRSDLKDETKTSHQKDESQNSSEALKHLEPYNSRPRRPQSQRASSAVGTHHRGTSRPYSSTSQVSHTSHQSRCEIPSAFQIPPGNDSTMQGPHSRIQSVVGDPPRPRPVQPKTLHASAWWHEPGHYPKKPSDINPPRRHKKRPVSVPIFESRNPYSVLESVDD